MRGTRQPNSPDKGHTALIRRALFVIVLAALGGVIGALASSFMQTRYEASATVALPADASPESFIPIALAVLAEADFVEGHYVEAATDGLRFIGAATTRAMATSRAAEGAQTFIASAEHPEVTLSSGPSGPDQPVAPRRLRVVLIGFATGAVLGLGLQRSLPTEMAESALTVPRWASSPKAAAVTNGSEPASERAPALQAERVAVTDPAASRPSVFTDVVTEATLEAGPNRRAALVQLELVTDRLDEISGQNRSLRLEVSQLQARLGQVPKADAGPASDARSVSEEASFLTHEVRRYQDQIEADQVAHARQLADLGIERDQEVDRLHSEHRSALHQLAEANRNLLAAHRAESEMAIASLDTEHRHELDRVRTGHSEHVSELRRHHRERLDIIRQQAADEQRNLRADDVDRTRRDLAQRIADVKRLEGERDLLQATCLGIEDQMAQTRSGADADRAKLLELENRHKSQVRDLGLRLERAEQRVANERRRTSSVVQNLLTESAATAAEADRARDELTDFRDRLTETHQVQITDLKARHERDLAELTKRHSSAIAALESERDRDLIVVHGELDSLKAVASSRERDLEATIIDLRQTTG